MNWTLAEFAGAIVLIGGAVAYLYGVLKWGVGIMDAKVNDAASDWSTSLKTEADAIKADIVTVKHKLNNVATRTDAIEHQRISDAERTAKMEVHIENLSQGQGRVETTLAEILRELRSPRT